MRAPRRAALFLLLAAAAVAVAAAVRPLPPPPSASADQSAEPGEGEAAALMEVAAAMGAPSDLLASWSETLASEGSLCGWGTNWRPRCSRGYDRIHCDNTTGAITEMQVDCWEPDGLQGRVGLPVPVAVSVLPCLASVVGKCRAARLPLLPTCSKDG